MVIRRIIDASIRHTWLVVFVTAILCIAGAIALTTLGVDAIPDIGDKQVIVLSRWDRSPDLVEDQVTYPIVSAMLAVPRVKSVRGISDFGYSYVYITFNEGTDIYWARSRVLEDLSSTLSTLPEGVHTELGPDATGLGWVFQYALVDPSGNHTLAQIRAYQDWHLRYQLRSVPGVADVASVGGYQRQFQINVDPNTLRTYGIPVSKVAEAVRAANTETTGRLLEFGGAEYMVRGRGYAHSLADFENAPLTVTDSGSQIRVKDVGNVEYGPDLRRGVADFDGLGDTVSGIVIMREGQDALGVFNRVKARIRDITPSLPAGVRLVPVYDRSKLISRTISTVKQTSLEVLVTVALIIIIFLWHAPSAAVPIITMPVTVLIAFIPCKLLGIQANIMSLAGVALAFSELVDASIVLVEQTHKKLEIWQKSGRIGPQRDVIISAMKEVSAPAFFALLVIAVSFLPVLLLPGQQGRLFRPLAWTKTLTLLTAAGLSITLNPVIRLLLARSKAFRFRPRWISRSLTALLAGKIRPEKDHPLSRLLIASYEPVVRWTLRHKFVVITAAAAVVLATVPAFLQLGSEAMPPLDEGTLLFMPTTMPGISVGEAQNLLQVTDRIIRSFPQVEHVLGKAGRADTATDPAPLSMLESVIVLKPHSEWPRRAVWYSSWAPEWSKPALRHITPDTITTSELIDEMNAQMRIPGLSNAWTMPIRGRIDMLSSGLRTPLGLKVSGPDVTEIQRLSTQIESVLQSVPGSRSVLAERSADGYYLDLDWDREQLARYGISMAEAQTVVENAIGGENVSTVVAGRERYSVNVRLQRDFRSDLDALARLPVTAPGQKQISLGTLAHIHFDRKPASIRDEDGALTGYVYIDVQDRDLGSYIDAATRALHADVSVPSGYTVSWSGQYESMQQVKQRLSLVVPLTILLIALLLALNTGSVVKAAIVLLALPFSGVGAIWFLYFAGYHMSASVWVGLIALFGIDAETGVFMLLYLDLSCQDAARLGRLNTLSDLRNAIVHGAAKRVRPKFMTFAITCLGLLPIMWANGSGSDLLKRIAAPMVGGIFTSFVLELVVYPALYEIWRRGTVRQNSSSELDVASEIGLLQPVGGD